MPIGLTGRRTPARWQLVVDQHLVDRVGIEAPRPRPVRRDVAGSRQLLAARLRVLGQPLAHRDPPRIVAGGSSKSIRAGVDDGSGASRTRTVVPVPSEEARSPTQVGV